MIDERWFCRTEAEWAAIVARLKLTPCPHCRTVGTLIRHGALTGFDDSSPRPTVRARRIFCSNRHRRCGCGRTVSVWFADKIRRLSLTTRTVWTFLKRAVAGTIADAIRDINSPRSDRTFRRIWSRFQRAQSAIRTALLSRGPPPDCPAASSRRPAVAQVLAHLQSTFLLRRGAGRQMGVSHRSSRIFSPRFPRPTARSPPSSRRPGRSFCELVTAHSVPETMTEFTADIGTAGRPNPPKTSDNARCPHSV